MVLYRLVERSIEKKIYMCVLISARLLDIVVGECDKKGLYLNSSKSFTKVFPKSSTTKSCRITEHGQPLEQVTTFISG